MDHSTYKATGTREEQCVLLGDSSSGETACGSDSEELSPAGTKPVHKLRKTMKRRARGARCHPPRSLRRLSCFALSACLLFLLLLVYLPLTYMDLQLRNVALPDWTLNTSRNLRDYLEPLQDTAMLKPREFCRQKSFITIVVCTSLGNFDQRQSIRETWGNTTDFNYFAFAKMHAHRKGHYLSIQPERVQLYADYLQGKGESLTASVRVVFIVGTQDPMAGNETLTRLHQESEQYQDIIQENFIDSYNNLTLKSVLALKHVSHSCFNSTAYFLKCDDDTFVNVPNLIHFLLGGTVPLYNDTVDYYDRLTAMVMNGRNRLNATSSILRGHQFCNVAPVSDVSSKWYMPNYMYAGQVYPKYLSGAGYLLSIDVVQRLYEVALNTSLIYLEDVFLTGVCAQRARIQGQHSSLFSFAHSKHLCAFKGSILQHEVKDDSMVEAWNYVSDYTIQCPAPGRYFNQMRLHKQAKC